MSVLDLGFVAGFFAGFAAGFVAVFVVAFVPGFVPGFVASFVLDFVVDFVRGFVFVVALAMFFPPFAFDWVLPLYRYYRQMNLRLLSLSQDLRNLDFHATEFT